VSAPKLVFVGSIDQYLREPRNLKGHTRGEHEQTDSGPFEPVQCRDAAETYAWEIMLLFRLASLNVTPETRAGATRQRRIRESMLVQITLERLLGGIHGARFAKLLGDLGLTEEQARNARGEAK
jgi:hypothetical protein